MPREDISKKKPQKSLRVEQCESHNSLRLRISFFSGGRKRGSLGGGQKAHVERVDVLFLSLITDVQA